MALVIRKDEDRIRGYLHLGTGNYNPSTAKIYTDLSLFTANAEFVEDSANLFNLLTGIARFQGTRKLLVAPFTLHDRVIALIQTETRNARSGRPARIIAKMNSLVDREAIEALYAASNAGVQIDLIVRGICCLRPGLPGVSENIRVRSIVGRFLEHSRVYYFENGGEPLMYAGSADWMPRNFYSRVEIAFPIENPELQKRLVEEILQRQLEDTTNSWILTPEALYTRAQTLSTKELSRNSQREFMELAALKRRGRSVKARERAAARSVKKSAPLKIRKKPD
jgi:polyphosphate kinase